MTTEPAAAFLDAADTAATGLVDVIGCTTATARRHVLTFADELLTAVARVVPTEDLDAARRATVDELAAHWGIDR